MATEKYGSKRADGDGDGNSSYTRTYLVSAADTTAEISIVNAAGVPAYGASYPYDPYAILSRKSASFIGGATWEVECTYEKTSKRDPDSRNPDPTLRPTEYEASTRAMAFTKETDLDGKPFFNSAQDPLKSVPPIEIFASVVTVTRYETSFSTQDQRYYAGCVNIGTFSGYAEGQVRISDWRGTREFLNDQWYWRVTRVFEICPDTFDAWNDLFKLLDQGFRYRDASEKLVLASDGGVYHDREVLLDGTGHAIPTDDPFDPDTDPVYLPFSGFYGVSFAPLGITLP